MKKSFFTLALAAASFGAFAQATSASSAALPGTALPGTAPTPTATAVPAGYTELLGATIAQVLHTGDAAELKALAGKLERAATVAPADWLPRYYQAYALLISVFQSKEAGEAKDKTLDQAEAALAQARQLKGDESELLTLQAYVYQARLGIAPMTRSMEYTGLIYTALGEAKNLNPANPRTYLVRANNVYYTPKMYGGGAEAARPLYEEAKAKFAAFRPATALAPSWGQYQLQSSLKQYEVAAAPATK